MAPTPTNSTQPTDTKVAYRLPTELDTNPTINRYAS